MTAPDTMRALSVLALSTDFSGCALVENPVLQPGPGQVLVRIEAAALGFPDLLMTRGGYQAKPPLPFTPGMEASGIVVAIGADVTGIAPGMAVIAGGLTGGVAQFGVYPAEALMPKPAGLSFAQAASLRAAYLTAWVALVRRAVVVPGEWLLVHGAAGGVGLAAVDLARSLGLRTIAVSGDSGASGEAKRAAIKHAFAPEHVIEAGPGFRDKVLEITAGRGVDVVYDPVGGDVFDESTRCIAFAGRLLVVGFAGGRIPTLSANVALIKGFSVIGVRAGEYGRRFPDLGRANVAAIRQLAEEGAISPQVHAELPLDRWRDGFAAMEDRSVVGRTVVLPWA
ncbi:NADPH:quinone oxidoreductase family protein [Novosphingobium sp.]|uniref:NADPH:quinone oxidoreductase family protein n=1 Tax=Novosphingobium sp. TaxID=1874826 RepID=UPI003456F816